MYKDQQQYPQQYPLQGGAYQQGGPYHQGGTYQPNPYANVRHA
jgi:hypothetical protein